MIHVKTVTYGREMGFNYKQKKSQWGFCQLAEGVGWKSTKS